MHLYCGIDLIYEPNMHLIWNQIHFSPLKENLSKTQGLVSRELSLSEWRHWQNKSLPTHVIDHSARCQHFIEVMELIDNMKEENEVRIACLYHVITFLYWKWVEMVINSPTIRYSRMYHNYIYATKLDFTNSAG